MLYKKYWTSYIDGGETFVCCEMTRDMTGFVSTKENPEYKYIKRLFKINTYEYQHCRDYLDENGLFMGIFPPELIEQEIAEWNERQERFKRETKERIIEGYKYLLKETAFKLYSKKLITKEEFVQSIEKHNNESYNRNGLIFTFEDYEPILNKYGIKYYENKEQGVWTGKNIL